MSDVDTLPARQDVFHVRKRCLHSIGTAAACSLIFPSTQFEKPSIISVCPSSTASKRPIGPAFLFEISISSTGSFVSPAVSRRTLEQRRGTNSTSTCLCRWSVSTNRCNNDHLLFLFGNRCEHDEETKSKPDRVLSSPLMLWTMCLFPAHRVCPDGAWTTILKHLSTGN